MQTSSISTGSRLYDRLMHGMSSDWASKVTGMLLASSVDLSALLEGPPAELDVLVARAISSVDAAALEALCEHEHAVVGGRWRPPPLAGTNPR